MAFMNSFITLKTQPHQVASLIEHNLLGILNTRLGTVTIRSDMGLPDLRGIYSINQQQLNEIANMVAGQLKSFEPRLQTVTVECIPTQTRDAAFQIRINGTITGTKVSLALLFLCLTNGKIITE